MKQGVIKPNFRMMPKSFHVMVVAFVFFIGSSLLTLFAAEGAISSQEVVDMSEFTPNYSVQGLPTLRIDKISMQKHINEVSQPGYHDLFMIDISPSAEYDLRHLDGAISVPVAIIGKHAERLKKLEKEKEYANNSLWIRVYSHNSIQEAKEAAKKFVLVGLKNVSYLDFTLDEWQKTGRPIVTRVPSLDRAADKRRTKQPENSILPVNKDKPPIINSLEIGPGDIPVLTHLPLGKILKLTELVDKKISIKNSDTKTHKYNIRIRTSKETGAKLKEGFEDIPDVSWIQPEYNEIEVSGNSTKEMEMYIKIPVKSQLLNKQYQAVFEAKSQKEKPEDIFVLVAQMLITFKTDKYEDNLSFTIISDESVNTGADYSSELTFLKSLPDTYSDMKIEKVDYSSAKGKQLVEKYNITFLPAYIFNPVIEQVKEFGNIVQTGALLKAKDGNYFYSNLNRPGVFINRTRIPKTLEIFFSIANEELGKPFIKEMLTAKKTGKIPGDVNLVFNMTSPQFVETLDDFTRRDSMSLPSLSPLGTIQDEEGMRWAYLQKYQKDKFYDYLLLSIDNISSPSPLWEDNARRAGLDTEEMKKAMMNEETKKLAAAVYKKANEVQPTLMSPYVLYENKVLILDPKLLNNFADFKDANIKTTKPCCGGATVPGVQAVVPLPLNSAVPATPALDKSVPSPQGGLAK